MARKRQARKCAAHCTDGRPCRGYAVAGGAVCAAHGGRVPQVKAAAARRVAEAAAHAAYQRYSRNGDRPVDVLAQLEHLVGVVTHFAGFAESRVAALGEDAWRLDNPARDQILAEIRMFERAQQAAGRLLTDVVRLDLYGRQVAQAKQIATWRLRGDRKRLRRGWSLNTQRRDPRLHRASHAPRGRAARRRGVSESDVTPARMAAIPAAVAVPGPGAARCRAVMEFQSIPVIPGRSTTGAAPGHRRRVGPGGGYRPPSAWAVSSACSARSPAPRAKALTATISGVKGLGI